jgi:hypothetical protein
MGQVRRRVLWLGALQDVYVVVWMCVRRKFQYLLDKSSPHIVSRWMGFVGLLALYFVRVFVVNGWYIVTYGLGIYLLNNFIGFLSPQVSSLSTVRAPRA